MTQPKALFLADVIEADPASKSHHDEAAAELRRLSAENERLHQINQSHEMKLSVRGYEIQIADLEAQRDALLEAAREGLSVCRSVSIRHDRRITRDGCLLYAQTEEWCRWAEAEVGPKIDAAIKAVEENT